MKKYRTHIGCPETQHSLWFVGFRCRTTQPPKKLVATWQVRIFDDVIEQDSSFALYRRRRRLG